MKAQLEVGCSAAIAAGARSAEGLQPTVNVVKEKRGKIWALSLLLLAPPRVAVLAFGQIS